MQLWDKIQELQEMLGEGDIVNGEHIEFLNNLSEHLDPLNPYEELSEKQVKFIHWLYDGYCNGEWEDWDDYSEAG